MLALSALIGYSKSLNQSQSSKLAQHNFTLKIFVKGLAPTVNASPDHFSQHVILVVLGLFFVYFWSFQTTIHFCLQQMNVKYKINSVSGAWIRTRNHESTSMQLDQGSCTNVPHDLLVPTCVHNISFIISISIHLFLPVNAFFGYKHSRYDVGRQMLTTSSQLNCHREFCQHELQQLCLTTCIAKWL